MSFCQAMLHNCANLMVQSIVPSANITSTDTDTNIIRDIRAPYSSFIGTLGSKMPEESKYHFANINYVIDKLKLIQGEDSMYTQLAQW